MPLPIRDGNQSLTTLSTLIVNSAHVPAHTVVSLGSQAITDIAQAVSGVELGPNTISALENISVTFGVGTSITIGNVVSVTGGLTNTELRASSVTVGVGNFPATQTVTFTQASVTFGQAPVTFGTAVITGSTSILNFPATQTITFTQASVTFGTAVITGSTSILNFPATQTTTFSAITGSVSILNFPATQAVTFTTAPVTFGTAVITGSASIIGTPSVTFTQASVTFSAVSISNFPSTQPVSIASVTVGNTVTIAGTVTANNSTLTNVLQYDGSHYFLKVGGVATTGGTSFPVYVAGTVTANPTGTQTIAGTVTANSNSEYYDSANAITLQRALLSRDSGDQSGDTEIIGAYSLLDPSGYVTLPISGTVTVGNTVTIAGTVTANPTGTQTIAGSVTIGAGTAQIGSVTASISNSVTIGSLPAISGTVTANTFALQGTAVTTSNFTSTTASTVLANYNATREVLTIFNEGAGNLHICAGATCTTIAYQVRLSAGDYYEVPNHQTTITHSAVFATAGTARVCQVS